MNWLTQFLEKDFDHLARKLLEISLVIAPGTLIIFGVRQDLFTSLDTVKLILLSAVLSAVLVATSFAIQIGALVFLFISKSIENEFEMVLYEFMKLRLLGTAIFVNVSVLIALAADVLFGLFNDKGLGYVLMFSAIALVVPSTFYSLIGAWEFLAKKKIYLVLLAMTASVIVNILLLSIIDMKTN